MKLSITFRLVTESENQARRAPFILASMPPEKARKVAFALTGKTAKTRLEVAKALLLLPRPKAIVPRFPDGEPIENHYQVTLTRIGSGLLDKVNLGGALKAVEDEVCKWLGVDDGPRDPRYRGMPFQQAQCKRGFHMVCIEIEDADTTREGKAVLLGAQPPFISDAVSEGAPLHKPPKQAKTKRLQRAIVEAEKRAHGMLDAVSEARASHRNGTLEELNERLAAVVAGGQQPARKPRTVAEDIAAYTRAAEAEEARILKAVRRVFYIDPRTQQRVLIPNAADPPPRVLRLHSEVDGVRFVAATLVRTQQTTPELGEHWVYDVDKSPDGCAVAARAEARGART